MVEELVSMVKMQSYPDLLIVLFTGVVVSLSILGFVLIVTRKMKSAGEED